MTDVRRHDEWRPTTGRLLVTVRTVEQPWQLGDGLEAQLALRHPRNFGNPGEFDYEAYLARRQVYVTGFAPSDRAWRRRPIRRWTVRGYLEHWRDAVGRTIRQTLDGDTATIVAALLIGEAAALTPEIRQRYARAGVSHVLAISGLHVGLVAAAAYAAARWLLSRSEWLLLRANVPKLALMFTALHVLFYAAIAGGSLSTIRAVVLVQLSVVATLVNRPRDWLACLAVTAIAISLWWPGSLFEISFQLSFVAVLAIVLGMRRVTTWWNAWEEARLVRLRGLHWRLLRWFVLSQAVTVCALLGTAPLTAWHFNRLSFVAVVANAFAIPLLGFLPVSIGLLATLVVPLMPTLASALLVATGAIVTGADWLVRLCATLPGASVRVISPSSVELVLLYGLLAALLIPRRSHQLLVIAICTLLLGADAAYWYQQRFHRGTLQLTFLSVGQGDSTLIEFPGSAVMVIDGGGLSINFDVGDRIVGPYLCRRKIGQVDYLVLTHADFDHFGGLTFLVRAFAPGAFWWNGFPGLGSRFSTFEHTVRVHEVSTTVAWRGFRRVIDGVEVLVLHPGSKAAGSSNDRSLTVQLRYGQTSVLFPGDLEAKGERALLGAERGALRSTILKVPHHGSRTSSSIPFVRAVSPRLAIVSAGYRNRFRMPHPDVLAVYRERGTQVWRTDRDGAVMVRVTEDGGITVTTGRQR